MRNNIQNKFIASIMLSAFFFTNTLSAGFAMDNYYGYGSVPAIRTNSSSNMVDLTSSRKIRNAESVVNLSLRDADISQVLRMFADQAGMNIIFSGAVEGTITMDLVDIPLASAWDLVVRANKLYYDIEGNTLVVSMSGDNQLSLSKRSDMTVIPVKYINAGGLAHFINRNFFMKDQANPGYSQKSAVVTNPVTNDLLVTGTKEDAELVQRLVEQFDKKPAITTLKVNHMTPAEMASMLCTTYIPTAMFIVSDDDDSSSGGAAGIPTGFASDEAGDSSSSSAGSGIAVGGGSLACAYAVKNDAFEDSSSGGGSGSDDESSELISLPYWNLSVSYFPTLGTIQVIGGSESQIEMIKEYVATNDKKTQQAYLEIELVSLNEAGRKELDNQWTFLSKNFSFNAGGKQGFQSNDMYPTFFAGKGYYLTDGEWDEANNTYKTTGQVKKWSMSPQLMYSIRYLITSNKGRTLANPKILMTSGQTSVIDLSSDYVAKVTQQYLTSSTNGTGSTGTAQTSYEIASDNGIRIEVTPFISPDGYVSLDITPSFSQIKTQTDTYTLLERRDLTLKGIRIKDGETLVLGGLVQENESKEVGKIPFLGDIPVIGVLFRSTTTKRSKEETIIMLTPRIVVDTEDAVADDVTL